MKKLIIASVSLCMPLLANAWGSYAHQQINVEALKLFVQNTQGNNPLAQCMSNNAMMVQRLAISPDYDWKKLGGKLVDPSAKNPDGSPDTRDVRSHSDPYEHPLHFFEADAFAKNLPGDIPSLPAGEYKTVYSQYVQLLMDEKDRVAMIDPSKALQNPTHPTVTEVTEHGSAPWRIAQLYALAIDQLANYKKSPNQYSLEKALIYLSAMGHYVGDMSQPLHASLNYDGQYNPPQTPNQASSAAGLHSSFETEMFADYVGSKSPENKTDFTYPNFDSTNQVLPDAQSHQSEIGTAPLRRDQIIPAVMQMIATGYSAIDPMVKTFAAEVDKAHLSKNAKNEKRKNSKKLASVNETVLEFAQDRMGYSSALLARIWGSVLQDSQIQNVDVSDLKSCPQMTFNRLNVVKAYPQPSYLPTAKDEASNSVTTASLPRSATHPTETTEKEVRPPKKAIEAFTRDVLDIPK